MESTPGRKVWTTGKTVASVERRVGATEDALGEYWCKWNATLSGTKTNWIPTKWPARNVHCFVNLATSGVTNIVAFPDWSPDRACTLNLYFYKTAQGAGILQSADGTAVASFTGTAQQFAQCTLSYIQDLGWAFVRTQINQPLFLVGPNRWYPMVAGLPEDERFAPVTE